MENEKDLFDYALQLAANFPSLDYDSNGKKFSTPHYSYMLFSAFYKNYISKMHISEESFYKQKKIMPVLEAYNLDKEQFWYAVAYVYCVTLAWAELKGTDPLPTALEQFTKLKDELLISKDVNNSQGSKHLSRSGIWGTKIPSGKIPRNEIKIIIDNRTESHSVVLEGKRTIALLYGALTTLLCKEKKSSMVKVHELPLWRMSRRKKTELTWYAAKMLMLLLDSLKLSKIRHRDKKQYKVIDGERRIVKENYDVVSYDKKQLIAEIIHFLGLTDNPNLDGSSIKNILKEKREFSIGF